MSNIAGVFNVPGSDEELYQWLTAHAEHHRDINRRIFELFHANLNEFILDPMDPNDNQVWQAQHQVMHQQMDAVLGINGFDLSEVNFNNKDLLTGWIFLNSSEHFQAANILGIG